MGLMKSNTSMNIRFFSACAVLCVATFLPHGVFGQEVVVPSITAITPSGNTIGSLVSIVGKNFDINSLVSFDGIYGTLIVPNLISSTALTFMIPSVYPGVHSVQVTQKGNVTTLSNLYSVDVVASSRTPKPVFSVTPHILNPESKTGETDLVYSLVDPMNADQYLLTVNCPQGITARMKDDVVCGNTVLWKGLQTFPITFNNTSGEYTYISVAMRGFDKGGNLVGKDSGIVGIAPFIGSLSVPTSVGVLQIPISVLTPDQKSDLIKKIQAAIALLTQQLQSLKP